MKAKRLTALLLVVCMLLTIMPAAMAVSVNSFRDFPTGWSKEAMTAAVNNGLLVGVSDTEIQPQANLTRAELAAIVTRAFGAKTKADISAFTDVSTSDWFYDSIAKAVKMEALQGKSASRMDPLSSITREEVFTAVARILVLESNNTAALDKFPDKGNVSSWAVSSLSALAEKGYVNGDETGKLNPKANITREEFAQFMHNMIKTYITAPGTYNADLQGITVIRTGGITLKGFINTNDLVAGDGVGTDKIILTNMDIRGRLLTRGGEFTLTNTTVSENVVVKNVNGITYFNNYKDEDVFKGINEITEAKFLEREEPAKPSHGGGGSGGSTKVTINFNLPDGTLYHSAVVARGTALSEFKPADPTPANGYRFDGWYRGTTKVDDTTAFSASSTLIAKFVAIEYTIAYNSSFGFAATVPTKYTIENAVTLPVEADFVAHAGYDFGGWYKDAAFADGPYTEIPAGTTGNMAFYAKWTAQPPVPGQIDVVFKLNASDTMPYASYRITEGTAVGADPAEPTKLGYDFDGWYDGVNQFDKNAPLSASVTYIAKFNPHVYTINYVTNEYGFAAGAAINTTYTIESAVTLPAEADFAAHSGWRFEGWYKDAAFADGPYTQISVGTTGNLMYYAKWSRVTTSANYTVQHYQQNIEDDSYTLADSETKTGSIGSQTAAAAKTYDGFTAVTPIAQETIARDGSTVVKVYYTRNKYDVTFNAGLGVFADGTSTKAENLKYGAAITAPANPTRTGYTFGGWEPALSAIVPLGGAAYTAKWIPGDVTYTVSHLQQNVENDDYTEFETETLPGVVGEQTAAAAKSYTGFTARTIVQETVLANGSTVVKVYYDRNKHTLTFNADGGVGGTSEQVKYGAPIVAPTVTKNGYQFKGWQPALSATMPDEDVTYTAQWERIINKVTVTFKLDAADTANYAEIEIEKGTSLGAAMPANPTKANFRFDGWYNGAAKVDSTTTFDADTTLIAKWTAYVKVTFKKDAADTDAYAEVLVEPDVAFGEANMPADPTKEHNSFNGWKTAGGDVFNKDTIVTADITVIADWLVDRVRVRFYDGYTTNEADKLNEVELAYGETVPTAEFPADLYSDLFGYKKGPGLASVYTDDYTHKVATENWYVDETTGEWKLFDDTIAVTKDMNVYRVFKWFGIYLDNPRIGRTVSVGAPYEADSTRTLDTVKDMTVSARNQLAWLMTLPKYSEYEDKIMKKLESTGLMTADREIGILDIPVAIVSVISPEKIRKEIKQYIEDAINDPAKLDSLFDIIDINELANQIGADKLFDMLTDAQILSILKDASNEDKVVDFIKDNLTNPTMEQTVIDYLKAQLSDPTSTFRADIIAEIKAKLATDTDLREKVLTDAGLLNSILAQPSLKDAVVDLATEDSFIETALSDDTLKTTLVNELVLDNDFVAILLNTTEFKEYVIDQLRNSTLGQDVKNLINTNSTFKDEIISEIKGDTDFTNHLKTDLKDDILTELGTYATKEDVVDYILHVAGSKDFSAFLSAADLEQIYVDHVPGWNSMTDAQKADALNNLASDPAKRDEIWAQVQQKVEDYKNQVIDEYADGTLANIEIEDLINNAVLNTIVKLIDGTPTVADDAIEENIFAYINDKLADINSITDSDIKNMVENARDGFVNTAKDLTNLETYVKEFRDAHENEIKTIISNEYATITDYIKNNVLNPNVFALLDDMLRTKAASVNDAVISDYLDGLSDSALSDYLKEYVEDAANDAKVIEYIKKFIASDSLNETFVATYRADIANALAGTDISAFVDKDMIKDYINGLSDAEKKDLADKIYANLETLSYFTEFMAAFDNKKDSFEINENNTMFVMAVAEAIKSFDYNTIIAMVNNKAVKKLLNVMGQDFLKPFFEQAQNDYYNGIKDIVDEINADKAAGNPVKTYKYSTSLNFKVNAVTDVLIPVYDKGQDKAIQILKNNNVYYDDNPYLKYLMEQDVVDELLIKVGAPTETLTGYKLKGELDYYDYAQKMLIIADDALCWYGDNLTEAQRDAIIKAVLEKLIKAHDKFNEIVADYDSTGNLPGKVENAINSVSQLGKLITKYSKQIDSMVDRYLGSGLNRHFESSDIMENKKFQTAVDIMLGTDDPVFTIDMLYDIFYRYDDKMQKKLKQLVDSGKLRKALDKFEKMDIAKLFDGVGNSKVTSLAEKLNELKNKGRVTSAFESMYDTLVFIADHGIEPFRIEETVVTTQDAYEVKIGSTALKVRRYYE